MVFTKYPREGIVFFKKFELLVFGGKKNKNWFECNIRIIVLINLSSIHIRTCENVFLTIIRRWCKMKIK
jgi:hypothetical protein